MQSTTCLYLLCGPSLAGKSTICERIVSALGAARISADEINAERGLPFGGDGLPESVWAETLDRQLALLAAYMSQGRSIVVDDTFCYRWLRDRFRSEAAAGGYKTTLLTVPTPREEILARHARILATGERPVLSLGTLLRHLDSFEQPTTDESPVSVASPAELEAWLAQELRRNHGDTEARRCHGV